MPRFAANLSFLFTELEFFDRFKAARDVGFDAVEFMFPYSFAKQDLAEVLKANNLELLLHNLPAGNWEAGERGIACHRHEPGTGEINYPFLFAFLDRIGYPGWIGCEYKPSKETLSSLGWLRAARS
jgi:hydroxypyruvate isomerase